MTRFYSLIILLFLSITVQAQGNKKLAYQKAMEAISLMDNGSVDESIVLLNEAIELDNQRYDYPYELAYAYYLKENYAESIKLLENLKSHKEVNDRLYQLLGNSYDMDGKTETALEIYREGLKKFPKAGILYLELGNITYNAEEYIKSLEYYEKGIEVDPAFPSNYYWAAKIYCNSSEKVWGVLYGEIFMNLERNSKRTIEISNLLFQTYKKAISITSDTSARVDFSKVLTMDVSKKFMLPFSMIFGLDMITSLGIKMDTSITISSLNYIRHNFIEIWYKQKRNKDFPNILFDYQKTINAKKHFEAYNHWIFMQGDLDEFSKWRSTHNKEWESFTKWFTTNGLDVSNSKKFYREQY